MDSTAIKSPETMDIPELLAELKASAEARGNDREARILRALKNKIASFHSTRNDIPLGWSPYGQSPRDLDALKE